MADVGRPPTWESVEILQNKIDAYLLYLKENKKPATFAGLAYHLGTDRKTIYNYSKKDEFFPTIKKYRDWIEMEQEEGLIQDASSGRIFLAKNYGYTDKQEVEYTGELNTIINIIPASSKK